MAAMRPSGLLGLDLTIVDQDCWQQSRSGSIGRTVILVKTFHDVLKVVCFFVSFSLYVSTVAIRS